ncbi:MAG TPA: class I SAM-dependent methyltransferase [Methylomirabilota bacterium]|nr:class I SAM-dependent methyltransferase [Methylomirabilota bacterium]
MKTRTAPRFRGRPALAFFGRVARQGWDKRHFTFTYKYPVLRRWLALQLSRPSTLLTIGCGRGELESDLEKFQHRVVSLDLSRPMLRAAAQRYGLTALVQADAHRLPFAPASFDYVVLPESLGYLEAAIVFREAARVLKRRGRLLMTTYPLQVPAHAAYKKRALAAITDALFEAGLVLDRRRFLTIKKTAVGEALKEEACDLLYVAAKKCNR